MTNYVNGLIFEVVIFVLKLQFKDNTSRGIWLVGEKITLADIAAAAHLSVVDYLGVIPWDDYPEVKEWYALIKSQPSFRPILADRVLGFTPPKYYANLDF